MRGVLKLPAYRRLLGAYTLSVLTWSVGSLALSFLVYRRTGSAIGAMAFFLCSWFFPAAASPWFVARLDQRAASRILPALYTLEGFAFLALAWVATHFALAPILALAAADGVIELVARSLSRAATVEVTEKVGLLRQGNALTNAAFSICFMAGPAVGGAVVALGGVSAALLIDSGLFALMALTLVTARDLPGAAAERTPAAGRVRAALTYAKDRPAVRALLGLQAAGLVFFTMSIPVEVVFVEHSLHSGAGGYGGLLSAWGAGAVAGSAVYARWLALPPRSLIALGAACLGVGFVVMAAAPSLAVAIIGGAVAGAGNGIEAVAARTALQEQVEQRWMAMMMSLNESLSQLVPGAGIVLGGAITALASPRAALAVAGLGALAVTGAVLIVLGPGPHVRGRFGLGFRAAGRALAFESGSGPGSAGSSADDADPERSPAAGGPR